MSQAKRGYVPGDDREFSGKSLDKLKTGRAQVQSGILRGCGVPIGPIGVASEAVRRIADLLSSLRVKLIPDVDRTLMEKGCVITADAIVLDTCENWFNLVKLCLDDLSADLIQVW